MGDARQADARRQPRPLVADRILDHLHQNSVALANAIRNGGIVARLARQNLGFAQPQKTSTFQPDIDTDFELWVWGLGYSIVRTGVARLGVELRTFVLPCPTDAGEVDLRLAISMRRIARSRDVHPLAAWVPTAALEWALEQFSLHAYVSDVKQDFAIWEHKAYLEKPVLAAGDGPVMLYRRYARQFYPAAKSGHRFVVAALTKSVPWLKW